MAPDAIELAILTLLQAGPATTARICEVVEAAHPDIHPNAIASTITLLVREGTLLRGEGTTWRLARMPRVEG